MGDAWLLGEQRHAAEAAYSRANGGHVGCKRGEGTYFKADTLEELLDQLEGIDKKEALASIERYNTYAEQGYDEEYQVNPSILFPISTPPFYGAKTTGVTFLTVMGGLRTDANLQICEDDDTPIEGLYCVAP